MQRLLCINDGNGGVLLFGFRGVRLSIDPEQFDLPSLPVCVHEVERFSSSVDRFLMERAIDSRERNGEFQWSKRGEPCVFMVFYHYVKHHIIYGH